MDWKTKLFILVVLVVVAIGIVKVATANTNHEYEQCVDNCQQVICMDNVENLNDWEMKHCMENCGINCVEEEDEPIITGFWSWLKGLFKGKGDGDGGGSSYDGYFKWKDEDLDCPKGSPPQCDTKA